MENVREKMFCRLVNGYAERNGAMSLAHNDSKNEHTTEVELSLIKVEFCYIKKASALINPSTLYCRIYPRKNSLVYYHLPDLWHQLGIREFHCCYFSFIRNEAQMLACFTALEKLLKKTLPALESALLKDEFNDEPLFDCYRWLFKLSAADTEYWKAPSNKGELDMFLYWQKHYNNYLVSRFNHNPAYTNFLKGKVQKALKLYEKWRSKGELLPYEAELADFMASDESEDFVPISEECFGSGDNRDITLGDLGKNFLVSLLICCPVFMGIFALLNYIVAKDSVACLMVPWYDGVYVGGLMATIGSIAFRRQLYRITSRKKLKEKLEIDEITNTKGSNIFAYTTFAVFTLLTFFFATMIASSFVVFREDAFTYDVGEFTVSYETRSYEDIDEVYYINSRYNYLGERIEYGSYVLVMKDGYTLDLYGYTDDPEECEKQLIPYLEDKGFAVKTVDSDRDLPYYDKAD